MSDTTPTSEPATTAQASSAATSAATGASPGNAAAFAEANGSTKISSMADLEKKAPDVAQAMKEGIAFNIINDMKHHNDRLKEIMREQRQQNG